jgi:hypothetical protein
MKQSRSETKPSAAAPTETPRRVVLLGASNLTKGIGTVLATAYRAWGQPLEVLAALGHGRSYGRASRVLGRELPGILECGLWPSLGRSSTIPTAALVTDIGNDVLFNEPVERIAGWVEACFDQLAEIGARTVVTHLPVDHLPMLSRARFLLMRTLFVPSSRLSLETVIGRAIALNERVGRLAAERGFGLVRQRVEWYGFDPIHIRSRWRGHAWREILMHWSDDKSLSQPARSTLAQLLYLRSRLPERRRVLGFEQRGQQPAARLRDGTTVAIY